MSFRPHIEVDFVLCTALKDVWRYEMSACKAISSTTTTPSVCVKRDARHTLLPLVSRLSRDSRIFHTQTRPNDQQPRLQPLVYLVQRDHGQARKGEERSSSRKRSRSWSRWR